MSLPKMFLQFFTKSAFITSSLCVMVARDPFGAPFSLVGDWRSGCCPRPASPLGALPDDLGLGVHDLDGLDGLEVSF